MMGKRVLAFYLFMLDIDNDACTSNMEWVFIPHVHFNIQIWALRLRISSWLSSIKLM